MAKLHARFGDCPIPSERGHSAYEALFRAIVFQQLSGKAAGTILRRVLALFDLEILGDIVPFPSPQAFLLMDDEALRGAGLSWNKIKAINDLSQKKIDGIVPDNEEVHHLPDDEIIERLISVRGIGRWSVQMYLIFTWAARIFGQLMIWACKKASNTPMASKLCPNPRNWPFWRIICSHFALMPHGIVGAFAMN